MMAKTHTVVAVATWTALTVDSPLTAGWFETTPEAFIAGTLICLLGSLLPDLDEPESTLGRAFPPFTMLLSAVVKRFSGGHRHATHTPVVGFLFVLLTGCVLYLSIGIAAAVVLALLMATAVSVCLHGFGFAKTGVLSWLIGAGFAWWLIENPLSGFGELAVTAIALGYGLHLLCDFLTHPGILLLWPCTPEPPEVIQRIPLIRRVWLEGGRFSLPLFGKTDSFRETAFRITLTLYLAWVAGAQGIAYLSAVNPG